MLDVLRSHLHMMMSPVTEDCALPIEGRSGKNDPGMDRHGCQTSGKLCTTVSIVDTLAC
jgi:hypothetical protein